MIAPEGTRTLNGKLGKFKKGAFHVAKNTGVTIIPVALIGAYNAKKVTDWRIKRVTNMNLKEKFLLTR